MEGRHPMEACPAPPLVANLGDIMGQSGSCPVFARDFSPLKRVVLHANGNLQRLVSSYHNSPVSVTQKYNTRTGNGKYDRQVTLSVFDQVFGIATSSIEVSRMDLIDAIENRGVAIGQLFRYFNILPEFALSSIGRGEGGRFWRRYTLSGCGITCDIHEDLSEGMFELQPVAATAPQNSRKSVPHSLGDIMSSNVTALSLPDGFTPLQRMVLTANGNVERLMSAFYALPVTNVVMLNHRRDDCVLDRQISMLIDGREVMSAKSTIFFTDRKWHVKAESEGVPIGSLFRVFNEMPTFHLRSTGKAQSYFWRVYTLAASGMTCEITETFANDAFERVPAPAGGQKVAPGSYDHNL